MAAPARLTVPQLLRRRPRGAPAAQACPRPGPHQPRAVLQHRLRLSHVAVGEQAGAGREGRGRGGPEGQALVGAGGVAVHEDVEGAVHGLELVGLLLHLRGQACDTRLGMRHEARQRLGSDLSRPYLFMVQQGMRHETRQPYPLMRHETLSLERGNSTSYRGRLLHLRTRRQPRQRPAALRARARRGEGLPAAPRGAPCAHLRGAARPLARARAAARLALRRVLPRPPRIPHVPQRPSTSARRCNSPFAPRRCNSHAAPDAPLPRPHPT